jgi:hypothetical protein
MTNKTPKVHAPKTLKEALARGHVKLLDHEKLQMKATYGDPAPVADCSTLNPGDMCAEYPCVDGIKIVMYCDDTKGCTHAVKVPC